MTPEGVVKAQVKKILDAYKSPLVYYFMPTTGGYGRSGIPDFVGCVYGNFFAIECKAGKGKTTALQDRELARIHNAYGISLVVNETNMHVVREMLEAELVSTSTNGEIK